MQIEREERTYTHHSRFQKMLPSLQHKAKLGSRDAHRTKNVQKVN